MNLFWCIYALVIIHCCLDKVSGSQDLDLCNSSGELPSPELFLDAGSGHMGDSIVLLCMHPSEGVVTRFFFCKDKILLSVRKAILYLGIYKLNVSQDLRGQYSCGYQHRNEMNQETTSALSSVRNLTVLSEKKWAIISGVLVFVILTLATLICYLIKKGKSHIRNSNKHLNEEIQCTISAEYRNLDLCN
ncbi:uncharacterized protein LOC117668982 isoform X2 [Pantherophis guttatus]|uniref:Uncharacterized protein LOC117668982 isoform X2 n=1 Tax=Pantherophis guttatus TaxID=94885 RepID=A0A6P9CII1_PANGU|nr:uncharacterized protein LOC117668982 isoform X2 [Pantherophis guttatus]